MLIVMKANASEEQVRQVCQKIEIWVIAPTPFPARSAPPSESPATRAKSIPARFEEMSACGSHPCQQALQAGQPRHQGRQHRHAFPGTDATIGGHGTGRRCRPLRHREPRAGLRHRRTRGPRRSQFFRGGAYKPRTSPYAFQGMGEEGLKIMAEVRERFGLLIITEAVDNESLELVEKYADVIQIGARNMQNFSLLKRAGRARKPVLLKRGMSATLEELLMAAEYIMSEGNYNVILCERGVRTFADHTRNTLDLSMVPAVQRLSHLPILVDPSHGTGKRNKVTPLSRAAVAVGPMA